MEDIIWELLPIPVSIVTTLIFLLVVKHFHWV